MSFVPTSFIVWYRRDFGCRKNSRLDAAEGQTGRNDSPVNGIVTERRPGYDKQNGKHDEQAL